MENTNCSMQNIFEWCAQNQIGISFRPSAVSPSVTVVFSKRFLGEYRFWSHTASIDHLSQMAIPANVYWSKVIQEAMHQLPDETMCNKLSEACKEE